MKMNYTKSESTIKPELVDTTSSKTTVYIRKNIIEKESMDKETGDSTTYYEYDETKLTKEEYQEYLKELEATDALQTIEDLKAENQSLSEQISMLTDCLLEMSEAVYA